MGAICLQTGNRRGQDQVHEVLPHGCSIFHALRESGSEMAKHFVVVAPNLTVFERLKEDFEPEGGGPDVS